MNVFAYPTEPHLAAICANYLFSVFEAPLNLRQPALEVPLALLALQRAC
jgi:hypothetical protein